MNDYAAVVRAHDHRTVGYIAASEPPCIEIWDEEIKRIRRRLVALTLEDLQGLRPEGSWLLGVVLSAGDDTTLVARFARLTGAAHRIRFFVHPDAKVGHALEAWRAAGFRRARADVVATWQQLHPLFGLALNDQVYEDFASAR